MGEGLDRSRYVMSDNRYYVKYYAMVSIRAFSGLSSAGNARTAVSRVASLPFLCPAQPIGIGILQVTYHVPFE